MREAYYEECMREPLSFNVLMNTKKKKKMGSTLPYIHIHTHIQKKVSLD